MGNANCCRADMTHGDLDMLAKQKSSDFIKRKKKSSTVTTRDGTHYGA